MAFTKKKSFKILILLFLHQQLITFTKACTNASDPYCIQVTGLDYRFMPSVGNGMLGTIIMGDTIHVAGVYNGEAHVEVVENDDVMMYHKYSKVIKDRQSEQTHRARIPSSVSINFTLNAEGRRNYSLDLKHGVFYQYFKNEESFIRQRIYAHRYRKTLLVNEIEVTTSVDLELNLQVNRGQPSDDIDFENFEGSNYYGMVGTTRRAESEGVKQPTVAVVYSIIPSSLNIRKSPEKQVFSYITAVTSSFETSNPKSIAIQAWQEANTLYDDLVTNHKREWEALWNNSAIEITGNHYVAQATLASMYNILSSVCQSCIHGVSPGGLPVGYEYLGHVFWDQETWMYPSVLMFHPKIAKALLQYRFERIPKAKENAVMNGYKGVMFPWESAVSGHEVCPGEIYAANEVHISGDIVFALKQYYYATRDIEWLRDIAYPIIYGVCTFWQSRVQYSNEKGMYTINAVMPPDEYQYPVNNSVYTNVVAKLAFEFTIATAKLLNESVPTEWATIAQNMFIPFDDSLQYHPEFEGFDIRDPSASVKQADTILINFPLMFEMDDTVKANDLKFYAKCTDPNGPAMTHSMFTIGWLDVQQYDNANKEFVKNFDNMVGPFHEWSEGGGGSGALNFLTGAGGYLQSIVFGYFGLRLTDENLSFKMSPFPNTTSVSLNGINYLDFNVKFHMAGSECYVGLNTGPTEKKLYLHYDSKVEEVNFKDKYETCRGVLSVE